MRYVTMTVQKILPRIRIISARKVPKVLRAKEDVVLLHFVRFCTRMLTTKVQLYLGKYVIFVLDLGSDE